ncbi:kinase-like domain-containing protein [Umbelopsis sp. AD052]|nr:kinase-like domain-containing protein [Umbelopsis sp. AD052]
MTTNESSSPQRESAEETSTSPKGPKGAPPPYADQDRRRSHSHDRQEETPRVKPRKVIGNFTLTNTLGAGSMGKVKLAVHNLTNEKWAVKIIPRAQYSIHKGHMSTKDRSREIRTIREASIMLLLHHPYIVSLKEMIVLNPYYYMFMEYVNGGQLLDYIISHGKLKEKQARRFARQILSALDYCHRNSIVHRDLKIENILISQSGHIKIIDFGLSNLFSPQSHLSTFCGSLYFAAPELLNAKAYTGPEVDLWSFGIVLYVLVCGRVPFDDHSMPALHAKIKRGQVEYPNYLSGDCKNLLSRLLVTDPARRGTMSEVLMHPWTNKGHDIPVDNYLPHRPPLSLPVDMEVVRGMTGFEFGSEQDIKSQLEEVICSPDYQNAAKIISKNSSEQINSGLHSRKHLQYGAKRQFHMPSDDPQSIPAAYHPLISVYYLVKERLERNRLMEQQDSLDMVINSSEKGIRRASRDILTGVTIPTISKPERAHPADQTYEQSVLNTYEGDGLSGIAYGRRSNTENEHPGVFRRLSLALGKGGDSSTRRHERHHSLSTSKRPVEPIPIPGTTPDTTHHLPFAPRSIPEVSSSRRSIDHFGHPFGSLLHRPYADKDSDQAQGLAGGKKLASGKVPAQELPAVAPNATTIGESPSPKTSRSTHETSFHRQSSERRSSTYTYDGQDGSESGTVDQTIRPVFLKGLFSVTTTSTKHPSVIRADLIHVLERIGVKWRESKGRFECVHVPSIDLYGQRQQVSPPVQEAKGDNRHTRKEPSFDIPDLVVRFEIYIVKVPWLLGMHGLQFRRVGGDPWQYKNMCSKILNELKL